MVLRSSPGSQPQGSLSLTHIVTLYSTATIFTVQAACVAITTQVQPYTRGALGPNSPPLCVSFQIFIILALIQLSQALVSFSWVICSPRRVKRVFTRYIASLIAESIQYYRVSSSSFIRLFLICLSISFNFYHCQLGWRLFFLYYYPPGL